MTNTYFIFLLLVCVSYAETIPLNIGETYEFNITRGETLFSVNVSSNQLFVVNAMDTSDEGSTCFELEYIYNNTIVPPEWPYYQKTKKSYSIELVILPNITLPTLLLRNNTAEGKCNYIINAELADMIELNSPSERNFTSSNLMQFIRINYTTEMLTFVELKTDNKSCISTLYTALGDIYATPLNYSYNEEYFDISSTKLEKAAVFQDETFTNLGFHVHMSNCNYTINTQNTELKALNSTTQYYDKLSRGQYNLYEIAFYNQTKVSLIISLLDHSSQFYELVVREEKYPTIWTEDFTYKGTLEKNSTTPLTLNTNKTYYIAIYNHGNNDLEYIFSLSIEEPVRWAIILVGTILCVIVFLVGSWAIYKLRRKPIVHYQSIGS